MKITTSAELKPGTRFTIAGVAFGPQYAGGFTTTCKPGHETTLVAGEEMEALPEPRGIDWPKVNMQPKRYGPAKHGRRF